MAPLQLSVMTSCFQQPLKVSLQTAADCGAQGVTLDVREELPAADFSETGRRQLLHYLGELGLRVAATTFPLRRPLTDPERLEARLIAIRKAMEFSFQLQARVLTLRLGRLPQQDTREYASLVEVLNDLAAHANRIGTTLAITLGRDAPTDFAKLTAAITQGPQGIHFDPAVLIMGRHSVADTFQELHQLVLHIQARDALRDLDGGGREVAVGRGDVAWDELLALLEQANYRQWLTIERTAGEDPIGDSARAIRYIRNVVAG